MTTIELKKTIANNIKRRRQAKGLSVVELANEIGKHKKSVYSIEEAKANTTVSNLQLYADALGCEAWELLKPFTLHKYGMRLRPFGIGCQPDGHAKYEDSEKSKTGLHGFVYYERELTAQEVSKFELIDLNE